MENSPWSALSFEVEYIENGQRITEIVYVHGVDSQEEAAATFLACIKGCGWTILALTHMTLQ